MLVREDYIVRQIAMLRELLAHVLRLRDHGQMEQAIGALMQAQEKLFERPLSEVLVLPLDGQLELLTRGFSAADARQRRILYAGFLKEAGLCFTRTNRKDLAAGAFKSALYVALKEVANDPARDEELVGMARGLLAEILPEELNGPTLELLAAIGDAKS